MIIHREVVENSVRRFRIGRVRQHCVVYEEKKVMCGKGSARRHRLEEELSNRGILMAFPQHGSTGWLRAAEESWPTVEGEMVRTDEAATMRWSGIAM